MEPVRRQISRCPQPATRLITRSTSNRLQWALYVCEAHRNLAPQLAGSAYLNHKATRYVERPAPQCGTLYDQQPVQQAIDSYGRLNSWLGAGAGKWVETLRNSADLAAYLQDANAVDLEKVARLAETGPSDPTVQARVLEELARIEAERTGCRQ
ncbi:hypothetical protein GTY67_13495 [Streptomyces sp. SID8374]|uniref:hypothetical protein n=1 Tax=Streptomyces sp. SID8374 TaxID=2690354 RepID=UPI0013686581|nr:hypothetical protein [Streptomyces sp. SID8374]MYX14411.1 hypothetical protein [Streptomyces sp. SID8374]